LEAYPIYDNWYSVGGLLNEEIPFICAGAADPYHCYIIGRNGVQARLAAAVVVVNGDILFITGGSKAANYRMQVDIHPQPRPFKLLNSSHQENFLSRVEA
jgi:hypothetical protein